MAIAHDANTRFPATENTTDTTTGNRSFTHTPTGTPKGVVVVVMCTGNISVLTGVSYGGVQLVLTLTKDDLSEAERIQIFTLTDSIVPTGAQTVVLQGCTATVKYCTVSTVTAATNATHVNSSNSANAISTNPQVTVTTTATTMTYGGTSSGNLNVLTVPATGNTAQNNADYGALVSMTSRRSAADAAGSIVLGWTFATSDNWAVAAVSLEEFTVNDLPSLVMGVWG